MNILLDRIEIVDVSNTASKDNLVSPSPIVILSNEKPALNTTAGGLISLPILTKLHIDKVPQMIENPVVEEATLLLPKCSNKPECLTCS